jgi:hypothetical protein
MPIMGVRRGGQGGLLPPLAWKNSIFFVVFQAKSRFLPPPPWKIFALPWKKSADANDAHNKNEGLRNQLKKFTIWAEFLKQDLQCTPLTSYFTFTILLS